MIAKRHRLRRARLWLQGLFSLCVIVFAAVVGIARLALPWIAAHPNHVESFLSKRIGHAVTIAHIDSDWDSNGPVLLLKDLRIAASKPEQPALVIPQAGLKLNFFAWLQRNTSWNELLISGVDLTVVRDPDGDWQLHGVDIGGGTATGNDENPLLSLGTLVLRDLRVYIDDKLGGRQLHLQAEEVRLVNSGSSHRALARVRVVDTPSQPVDVVLDYDSDTHDGEAYLGGQKLDLAAILHGVPVQGLNLQRGTGRAQLWTWWRGDRLTQVRAEIDLADVILEAQTAITLDEKSIVAPHVSYDHIAFGARWQRADDGWSVDVADLSVSRQDVQSPIAHLRLQAQHESDDSPVRYLLSADSLEVGTPLSAVMLVDSVPKGLRRWLYIANPNGIVRNVALRYAGDGDFDMVAQLENFSWHAVDKAPGGNGISGRLLADQVAFSLELPTRHGISIDDPLVFRRALEFSEFSGDIAAYRTDASWRIETDALKFEGAGYGGELAGAAEMVDGKPRPLLDLGVAITHADVVASHLFWPINTMAPPAVAWLDRGLDGGRVVGARATIRGDLSDWPFRNYSGRFEARAEIEDLRIKYLGDWPVAEHMHALASFVNVGLHIDIDGGGAMGIKVNKATGDIPNLDEAVLDLGVAGQGSGRDMLDFLRATPVGEHYGAQLLGVDLGGSGSVDFHMNLPVKHRDQMKLNGTVNLADADISDAKYALHLDKANGKLRFGKDGFSADDLAVLMQGQPASFSLMVGAFTAEPQHAVEASLSVNLPARSVLAYAPGLAAYADHITGNTDWSVAFSADRDSVGNAAQRLTLASDMRGIAVDLPEPLKKPAEASMPLTLTLGLPFAGASLDLKLADVLRMHARLATDKAPFAARFRFGDEAGELALPKSGFLVDGKASRFDLSGWLDFATSNGGGKSGDVLSGIDLRAASLSAWERDFGEIGFKLTTMADELTLAFTGTNLDGELHIPRTELHQRGITAQFTHLFWPENAETETPNATAGENPAALPPLHIRIGDFRLGDTRFGEATVESYPIANGTHFEQVSTHSANVDMRAHGDWSGRSGRDRSQFVIDFSARNLGQMLGAFDHAGVIDGGESVAHIEGSWAGSPSTFALAKLDGTLKVSVKAGRIPEVDPGAGRILGLLNLAAIPRRLAFDFGDLFKSGFSFDSINGLFTLKDGNAFSSDLEVKSSAADMRLNGRMGLKTKDWDQVVEVTPHVGSTFAIGGGLLGGPVGAAAGVLMQGIFRNQINAATRARYSVSGSWENPTVTSLGKVNVKPTPPAPAGTVAKPKSDVTRAFAQPAQLRGTPL